MITHGILRVWSQVGLSCQLLAASIINIKQPVATAERYAPITPYPAERMLSAHAFLSHHLIDVAKRSCLDLLLDSLALFFRRLALSTFPEGRLKHWRRKTETL